MRTTRSWMFLLLITMILAFASFEGFSSSPTTTGYDMLADNPLKGFIPYAGLCNFPHSMEWFYIPLSSVQTDYNTFDWTPFESQLNDIASRGNQACFRFYLDYPNKDSGIPEFLITDGLKTYSYADNGNTGLCPDYKNPKLQTALTNFIAALGSKYDGDPRIGFITAGLLGFWGEWHCYPHKQWEPSAAVFKTIMSAYTNAFHITPVLIRYPKGDAKKMNLGYHDDSFCYETLPTKEWNFMSVLRAAGCKDKWQTNPIGGELRPEIQGNIFNETPWGISREKWTDCLASAHPTWLLNGKIKSYSGTTLKNAIEASKQMGYTFQVVNPEFKDTGITEPIQLRINIKNTGVAPFYYKWDFLMVVKQNGKVVKSWSTGWDIRTVPTDSRPKEFTYTTDTNHGLSAGTYTIAVKLVNPLPKGKNLRFDNEGQNQDGWLDLGNIKIY